MLILRVKLNNTVAFSLLPPPSLARAMMAMTTSSHHHTPSPLLSPILTPGRTGARDATCLEPQVIFFSLPFFSLLNSYLQVNYNNEWLPPPLPHPKTGMEGRERWKWVGARDATPGKFLFFSFLSFTNYYMFYRYQ